MADKSQVLDLSKTQVFYVRAQLDTVFRDHQWVNPVPVYGLNYETLEDRLGFATIFQDGDRYLVDLFLRRDCPERPDIETGNRRYWIRPERVLANGHVPRLLIMDSNWAHGAIPLGEPIL